ncbi:MAG: hypothetical protein K0S74_1148 [Chlamydiales bacterium]|jgi:glucosamine 6-phosphate synthetase-like amidotransferase/phosphosugar isomerase protein|nr:hypothetical protein [Chlamydiales bacterium]
MISAASNDLSPVAQTTQPNRPSPMKQSLNFRRARRRGFNPEQVLQEQTGQKTLFLEQKTHEVAQVLLGRQQQAETLINGLISEIEDPDWVLTSVEQSNYLEQIQKELKETQEQLMHSLKESENELNQRYKIYEKLQKYFSNLQHVAKQTASHSSTIDSIQKVGEDICKAIISHNNTGSKI